jgi:hypothetical protein
MHSAIGNDWMGAVVDAMHGIGQDFSRAGPCYFPCSHRLSARQAPLLVLLMC